MANEDIQSLSLKVLVEKEKNQVVFAEPSNDFVDVLFSFMTLPIGTIIILAREHSLEVDLGCLNNLYQSVENLNEEYVQSVECKGMLLRPRSAAEIYCRNLKLNFVNSYTNNNVYYACGYGHCFGPYCNALCHCGDPMTFQHNLNSQSVAQDGGVFVRSTARFLITDDFHVKPMSTMTGVTLLSKFGATDRSTREERTINIGNDKVIKLLMCSLTSRAAFSEAILESDIGKRNFGICHEKYGPRSMNQSQQRAVDATKEETKITLNLIVNKSNNKTLFVEAKADFVDLIGSFLTFPVGFVFEKFSCMSLRGCLCNLYKNIQDFDVEKFFKSEEMKGALVNPKLPPGLALNKQLIPIKEASYPSFSSVNSSYMCNKYHPEEVIFGKGLIRGPSLFMVTNDFTIMPLSSLASISFLDGLDIPLTDILEQEVTMGEKEALRLLEAALVSKTALTDVFQPKEPNQNIKEESHN